MSFNNYLNRKIQNNTTTSPVDKFVKQQKEEKELVKSLNNNSVNHKSNIFKILKTNKKLTTEECKELTLLIDEYYSKF